jgi:hypothetical protein
MGLQGGRTVSNSNLLIIAVVLIIIVVILGLLGIIPIF